MENELGSSHATTPWRALHFGQTRHLSILIHKKNGPKDVFENLAACGFFVKACEKSPVPDFLGNRGDFVLVQGEVLFALYLEGTGARAKFVLSADDFSAFSTASTVVSVAELSLFLRLQNFVHEIRVDYFGSSIMLYDFWPPT